VLTFRRSLLTPCPRFPKDLSQRLTHYVGQCLLAKVYLTYRYTMLRNSFYFRLQLTRCPFIDIFLHFRINFFNTTPNTLPTRSTRRHSTGAYNFPYCLSNVSGSQWAHSPTPSFCVHILRCAPPLTLPPQRHPCSDGQYISFTQKIRR
jgi:hypothetical protein